MWLLFLLSCRLFYYGDDEVSQVEVTKVVNSWNVGINRSHVSSLKILVMTDDGPIGHGSANLFHYQNQLFVITVSFIKMLAMTLPFLNHMASLKTQQLHHTL